MTDTKSFWGMRSMFYELPNCPDLKVASQPEDYTHVHPTEAPPGQPNYSTIYRYRLRDAKLQHPGYHPRKACQHHSQRNNAS